MSVYDKALVEAIVPCFKDKKEAVKSLSKALSISESGVYRRLSGNTNFSLDEACRIANLLFISLDEIAGLDKKKALFNTHFYDKVEEAPYHFLKDIYDQFEAVAEHSDGKLHYVSRDLPLFFYLNEPKLLAFKLYVWSMNAWSQKGIQYKKFNFDFLGEQEIDLAQRIYDIYCEMPSCEVWNNNILDSSFDQIQYLEEANLFESETIIKGLKNSMHTSLEKAKNWAIGSTKKGNTTFDLYHTEFSSSTNNVIFFESKLLSIVISTLCDPDYISSRSRLISERTKSWLNRLINQANVVTSEAFKWRNLYFQRLVTV